jgi:hypothetical protein
VRLDRLSPFRNALGATLAAAALIAGGLAVFPVAAIAGGTVFVGLGVLLAYDVRGLGGRWIAWKRDLGGPTLGMSVWLDRTIDGAAIAWLGIAAAWAAALAL